MTTIVWLTFLFAVVGAVAYVVTIFNAWLR